MSLLSYNASSPRPSSESPDETHNFPAATKWGRRFHHFCHGPSIIHPITQPRTSPPPVLSWTAGEQDVTRTQTESLRDLEIYFGRNFVRCHRWRRRGGGPTASRRLSLHLRCPLHFSSDLISSSWRRWRALHFGHRFHLLNWEWPLRH